ncbi:hypothetical protein BKA93DRAFT_740295 [Sparassis latifolia]|uniref:Uncharacterized protein n=1 Tax=Sparassis crispa TaxID=139825 RepID=A0A401GID7_9APHY|nr:hypothetical protein SCP_0403110 [Sparassis crispa]GBE81937.1 hypothetical protein SCP_0403110 [Sparassis crispa]
MLRLRAKASLRIPTHQLHVSALRHNLVGPPDPVSHLRPIIYEDAPSTPLTGVHPYSLKEFAGDTGEYQWKMQRQELDAYNNAFWTDSNIRFEAAKSAVLESLPETAPTEDREFALSEFYKRWLMQEQSRQKEYNSQWRKRNWTSIVLGARVRYEKFKSLISRPFTSRSDDSQNE